MAPGIDLRRRREPVPSGGPPSDRASAARVSKHRSSNRGRLPRQRGAPAKNLHLIDDDDLDEFLSLETVDIQRMLRRRKRNLSESGTKVELWLRLKESDRVEARAERRRAEAALAEAATEAAIENCKVGTMNIDTESAGASVRLGGVALQEADIAVTRQAHEESGANVTRSSVVELITQEEINEDR